MSPRREPPTGPGDDRVQRIRATVDAIPPGRVATYGDVAREAGLPGRARLVGRILREGGAELPWHRVLAASGTSSLPGRAAREQLARLRREGVPVDPRGRVDLPRCRWPRTGP